MKVKFSSHHFSTFEQLKKKPKSFGTKLRVSLVNGVHSSLLTRIFDPKITQASSQQQIVHERMQNAIEFFYIDLQHCNQIFDQF